MITKDIKTKAKDIWKLLVENKSLLVSDIYEKTHHSELYIFLALGWLAREKRINFYLDNQKALCIQINDPSLESTIINRPYTDIFY